jgi:hypothetical protein
MNSFSRRTLLRSAAASATGLSSVACMRQIAAQVVDAPQRKRACILLWMAGGPSQLDTFDLKPGHANGGPFRAIATSAPEIRISEHLPLLACRADHLAVIRSMHTKEGDHARATHHLRTGYASQGSIRFPSLGAAVSKELGSLESDLPSYVSVLPQGAFTQGAVSAGFLGPRFAPLVVGGGEELRVEDLHSPRNAARSQRRLALLGDLEAEFHLSHPGAGVSGHVTAYDRAVRLQRASAAKAFDLRDEPPALRERYGSDLFGQGCLLARRLVERGVSFVEVTLNGWDTHDNNFEQVHGLSGTLDAAWSSLLDDLQSRGLLETTTIVWMGEFGRTPSINPRVGRDHFPAAWSVVLGGGGIRGGQVIGRTSVDGMQVEDAAATVPDLMATICTALGVDPRLQNDSNVDRPIRLVDPIGQPVREALV